MVFIEMTAKCLVVGACRTSDLVGDLVSTKWFRRPI